jgi:hypothetical protein
MVARAVGIGTVGRQPVCGNLMEVVHAPDNATLTPRHILEAITYRIDLSTENRVVNLVLQNSGLAVFTETGRVFVPMTAPMETRAR